MSNSNRKTLAVIGAGPKGIAIAIKAKVLEEFGLPVDRVILIEKNHVAANWSGDFGYTNGEMKLGTSPEKDVVFPIEIDIGDHDLNQRIQKRLLQFTWTSFLVETKEFSDWVDRGRPAPCHRTWANYLQWIADQLQPHVQIIAAHVTSIDLSTDESMWELKCKNIQQPIKADRLMLTGPGSTRLDFIKGEQTQLPKNTYDLESFWSSLQNKTLNTTGRLAIIGAGENAASILLALAQYSPGITVDVISPKGFISTRSENFYENQMYSQPDRNNWSDLEIADRVDFIERTDLGVFSGFAMSLLNEQRRHTIIPGRVINLKSTNSAVHLTLSYAQKSFDKIYDTVILASGFDQVATLKSYLAPRALLKLQKTVGKVLNQTTIMASIQSDLSIKNMEPKLHLPMLASLNQGPGFANLSCLGRLSDRIVTLDTKNQLEISNKESNRLMIIGDT